MKLFVQVLTANELENQTKGSEGRKLCPPPPSPCPQDQPLALGSWLPAQCSAWRVAAEGAHPYQRAALLPGCKGPRLRALTLLVMEPKVTPCIQQFAEDPLVA